MPISKIGHSILVILAIIPISCSLVGGEKNLSVVEYSGPAFTEVDVYESWDIGITGTKITLKEIPRDSERAGDVLVLTIEGTPQGLPVFKDLWYGPIEGGYGIKIDSGRLEIQSWDLESVISGAVATQLPTGGKVYMRFWVTMNQGG